MLDAKGKQYPYTKDACILEALSLCEAALFVLKEGYGRVQFYGDAKVLVDHANNGDSCLKEAYTVVSEAAQLATGSPSCCFSCVRRACHGMAHSLA